MSAKHLLVIDDEALQRETLAGHLRKKGHRVSMAADGQAGLELARSEAIDLVITDMRMPHMTGQELLEALRAEQPHVAVILTTAYGSVESAVEAMRAGAFTFLSKPIDLDQLDIAIERALERQTLVRENQELRRELMQAGSVGGMVVGSPQMEEVLSLVARVAPSKATVLVLGESGTGKERVARAIHAASPRAAAPFVPVNMAALPETLAESELFGHEKGAFTGADRRRQGLFEQADGGTLFIDEVGDIPLPVQVKLLRVLQEGVITRLGGRDPLEVDVRVVAATHRDLPAAIAAGEFREDLYYRLNVVAIPVPPLRERRQDIPVLIEHFLAHFGRMNGKQVDGLEREALDLLMKYPFPGNVRELENAIERAVVLSRGQALGVDDLPATLRGGGLDGPPGEGASGSIPEQVEALEQRLLRRALEQSGGNQSEAARLVGLSEKNVRDRLRKWGWK